MKPSALDRVLLEDERQEQLLVAATSAADALMPEGRRRLYRHLKARVEAEAGDHGPVKAATIAGKPEKLQPGKKTNGKGSYADQAEAFVLSRKNGVTTREVADAIGQKYPSADGTLRHIAQSRGNIVRQDDKWCPTGKQPAPEVKTTIRTAIAKVFEANGNTPLASRDIYTVAKVIKPDMKKSSMDAELVIMRTVRILVLNGTAPHGGGLYQLATGGAQASNA